ncbi:hypothetical protein JI739_20720 [Ramlibacter sp. AW1]|uniref:Uncharacterized protein n=1 Tax=Ramlibacter aurantiacus TaxID=2801330 RepID=A0A936ZUF5_9BURK|nr:hypothetical protein [Ramlibacter aurantiacus]MBL0422771.1 hypothetical protein [Ramlibacter aurantiacus]
MNTSPSTPAPPPLSKTSGGTRQPRKDVRGAGTQGPGTRIAGNAAIGALSVGTWFGSSFALANWLRAAGPPHAKVLAGFALPMAGFTSGLTEHALREWSGVRATPPQQPSLAHDAVPSLIFFTVNAGYHGLRLPAFPATTPAGAAVTLGLSLAATGLAGAATEAVAQASRTTPVSAEATRASNPDGFRTGIGRANGLLPLALLGQCTGALAMRGPPPPSRARSLALTSSAVAAFGWTFRRVLAPGESGEAPAHAPDT